MEVGVGITSLIIVSERPFNAESDLEQLGSLPTPVGSFYVRCNFDIPSVEVSDWSLLVRGNIESKLSLERLKQRPAVEQIAVLECAGNARKRMQPLPPGTPWDMGAVSWAIFRGCRLRDVLHDVGVPANACEVLFRGLDSGTVEDGRSVHFERSLPIERALDEDVLLAYEMNGAPLAPQHGFPLRLLVPGWYGVASVKWLEAIEILVEPFVGHFQTERYVYRSDPNLPDDSPVREVRVRSLITRVTKREIAGLAWSGSGSIEKVEVSVDDGANWSEALLSPVDTPAAPTVWTSKWTPINDSYSIVARATDVAGNAQPLEPVFNELGYANNLAHRVTVTFKE